MWIVFYVKIATVKERLFAAAILFLFLAHALFYFVALGYDAVDDAYISFRYAQNAILGNGLVFNVDERVEGFTNFLWTAMMVPIAGASLDVGRVSIVLGILFALATIGLTKRLAQGLGLRREVGWLATLLLAVDGSFAIWSVGGLETAMFAFLITAGAAFYLRESRASAQENFSALYFPASAVFFALAAMTRPEAAAVFALTVAHQFVWRVLDERRVFGLIDVARVFTFAALFVPYWIMRWRYYHSFFPNSFYAKVAPGGPAAQLERGGHYVTQFINVHLGGWILIPAALAVMVAAARYVKRGRSPRASSEVRGAFFGFSYLALLLLAYGAYIIYVGGDWSVGRFFVPILPLAYLLIAAGLVELYQVAARRFMSAQKFLAPLAVGAALALAVALAFASSWNGEYGIYIRSFDAARASKAREMMGRWLKANVPRGTWIAVDAAGQVPYFSELPAIDMFGINDLHIGRLNVVTLGQGTPGHEKFDLGYIITRAPRFVIIYGTLFDDVTEYHRAPVEWTQDEELKKFLNIYERK